MTINRKAPRLLLGIGCLSLVVLWWPGILRPDSLSQLVQAQSGNFGDHHPPIMAYLWRALSHIKAGPAPLLMFHMGLLFAALSLFQQAVLGRFKYFYVLIPFFPHVLSYSGFVLKDVGFTYSFLLCFALLAKHTIQQQKLSPLSFASMGTLLFYGTAVKYQGIFIMPVVCLWIIQLHFGSALLYRRIVLTVTLSSLFFGAVTLFNDRTVPVKSHSWQFVKIYDLVGISLKTKLDHLPDFTKTPSFTEEKMAEKYNTFRVDEMVFGENPILQKGQNEDQRNYLWHTWFKTIGQQPSAYLFHRSRLMANQLTMSPLKKFEDIKSNHAEITSVATNLVLKLDESGLFSVLKALSTFLYVLPFSILYFFLGIAAKKSHKDPNGTVLSFLNGAGLLLICVLFVFSMAAEARYIYLSVCCFHLSHPFAYACLRSFVKRRTTA